MNTLSHFLSPLRGLFSSLEAGRPEANEDQNDLTQSGDLMGTVCDVHGCPRALAEAPIVAGRPARADVAWAKRTLFPNSWSAVASLSSIPARAGWFQRRASRTVAVRYCAECRAAAERWLQEHLSE